MTAFSFSWRCFDLNKVQNRLLPLLELIEKPLVRSKTFREGRETRVTHRYHLPSLEYTLTAPEFIKAQYPVWWRRRRSGRMRKSVISRLKCSSKCLEHLGRKIGFENRIFCDTRVIRYYLVYAISHNPGNGRVSTARTGGACWIEVCSISFRIVLYFDRNFLMAQEKLLWFQFVYPKICLMRFTFFGLSSNSLICMKNSYYFIM